jgi:peptide/nickel transport system substrate-binding protein
MTRFLSASFRLLLLPALVLALAMLVACGTSGTPETAATAVPAAPAATKAPVPTAKPVATTAPTVAKPTGTLNVGFKEMGAFDAHPRITAGQQMLYVGVTTAETLLAVNSDIEFVPKLVKEWSVSPDTLIWTFKLHEGVQFHKGYGEVTAEDVIWSIGQYAAEGSKSPRVGNFKRLWFNEQGYSKAIDDHTIEVHTGVPQYDMLINISAPWAGAIFSKQVVDDLGEDEGSRTGVGTGPWEYVEARTGQFWKFKAVEGHYRKTPEFAELIFWEMPEESTRVANFQVGKVDSINMAIDSKPAIEKVPGTKFMTVEGGGTEHLAFLGNWYVGVGTPDQAPGYDPELPWISSNPDLNSPEWERARKVRMALSIAIDRQLIVDTLLGGEGKTLVMWGWEDHLHRLPDDIREWPYDPERAKKLLADAGYADGFEITVTPSIRSVPAEVEACDAIGTMWEAIGIRTRLNHVPYDTIGPQITNRTYNQANCHGTGGFLDPLALEVLVLHSDRGTHGATHPWLDEMLDKAVGTVDTDERFEIMVEVGRFVFENVMEAGLYSVNLLWPLGPKVDPWPEHLEKGDRRILSGLEYAPHRK